MQKNKRLIFTSICSQEIFGSDFAQFCRNNTIDFDKPIAILYAPNGVGKTSFAKVLDSYQDTNFVVQYNDKEYTSNSSERLFHVIADQNGRNIIHGETEDFVLGDDIRKERHLKQTIDEETDNVLSKCKNVLKLHGITKKGAIILDDYGQDIRKTMEDLANQRSDRASGLSAIIDLNKLANNSNAEGVDVQSAQVQGYINERNNKESILSQFLEINLECVNKNENLHEIGENTDAIKLLTKYANKNDCIVCDSNISPQKLLEEKEKNKKEILELIDNKNRDLVERIMLVPDENDIFGIKKAVEQFFETRDNSYIQKCKDHIIRLGQTVAASAVKEILDLFKTTNLFKMITEHEEMIKNTPILTEEDALYIQEIISQSMDKTIKVVRDDRNKNLVITLEGGTLIEKTRDELPLSAGEQNFLSLAFEILKAKNNQVEVIVLDDPISSFDSIYKYKVVYLIAQLSRKKKIILLTHNLDLVRLLRCQMGNCFQMYILNNGEDKDNGFIKVNEDEISLMTDLSIMVDFFRTIAQSTVKLEKEYLIATVPFMRSFAKLVNEESIYDNLIHLMHGRSVKKIDIAACYNALFSQSESKNSNEGEIGDLFKPNKHIISIDDIVSMDLPEDIEIIDSGKYPLFNKTLVHTIEYLKMRLIVEKNLVDQFHVPAKHETTNEIIQAAYSNNSNESVKNRTKLMVKKTLLNEFNHYEGHLSIFQPAIDISDKALRREKEDLKAFFSDKDWKKN